MSYVITNEVAFEIGNRVRDYVDSRDSKIFAHNGNEFSVYTTPLAEPRIIGDLTARFLRVAKGLSGPVFATALYSERGLEPHSTGVLAEMPLRVVSFYFEGPASYLFNGGVDARDFPLPNSMAQELLEDIEISQSVSF